MNHSINFEGDWALHGIMSDLGVNYALSPFHRIGFEIDDAGIQTLAERYHDRVFRARKWFDQSKLSWMTLLLRFDETPLSSRTATGATMPKSSRLKPVR